MLDKNAHTCIDLVRMEARVTFEAKVSSSASDFSGRAGRPLPSPRDFCDADELAAGETFGHLPLFKLKQLQCRSTPNSQSRGNHLGGAGGVRGVCWV